MSARTNYFKLGLFVLASVGFIIAGIIVLSAGALKEEQVLMETYITESVQGLSEGSPVKRSGVKIGTVKEITFVSREYAESGKEAEQSDKVMVIMSIDQAHFPPMTPMELRARIERQVKRGLRLKLASQGITGIAYLDAEFADPERYPPPKIGWTPKRLYIPSVPSTITSFTQSVDRILTAFERIDYVGITSELKKGAESLRSAVDDLKVGQLRKELIGLMADMKHTSGLVRAVIDKNQAGAGAEVKADVAGVLASLDRAAKSAQKLVEKSQADLQAADIPKTIARLDRAAKRLEQLTAGQQGDMDAVMANLRLLSENLMKLSESAKQYPSQVLFGSAPPHKEKKQ